MVFRSPSAVPSNFEKAPTAGASAVPASSSSAPAPPPSAALLSTQHQHQQPQHIEHHHPQHQPRHPENNSLTKTSLAQTNQEVVPLPPPRNPPSRSFAGSQTRSTSRRRPMASTASYIDDSSRAAQTHRLPPTSEASILQQYSLLSPSMSLFVCGFALPVCRLG